MESETRHTLAHELASAYSGTPVEQLTVRYPDMDIDDAYAIQRIQVEDWVKAGRTVAGHKIGLTSQAMQEQLGVDQPDYGVLLDDFFYPENTEIAAEGFVAPKVEPEVAFLLKHDLAGPHLNAATVIAAVDWVFPALELIDSRVADWQIGFFDTVADNASSAGVVLGSDARRPGDVDLRKHGVNLKIDGSVVQTGAGAAVLGSPINAIIWLANVLAQRGECLRAGQVILPGSTTASVPVAAGTTVTAEFGGIGTITTAFA